MRARLFSAFLAWAVAGCAQPTAAPRPPSACAAGEASYACQVERYHKVSEP